jgi:carbamoyl-phosphate synthase large subunit
VKFQGSDILLGPEMKSTGEVMGIARTVGVAFAKGGLPRARRFQRGTVFVPCTTTTSRRSRMARAST